MRINGDLEFFALDGGANSIKNAFIERLAGGVGGGSLPANGGAASGAAGAGRIAYNSDDNLYYFYDGTDWEVFGTGGAAGGIQTELDTTQASMGYVNVDGTFNEASLNALGNITGLTGSDTLVAALTQLDAAITAAAGVDTLGELTDVTLTSLTSGDVLYSADGSTWVNADPNTAGLVALAGTQTITGAKTFNADLSMGSGADIAADTGAAGTPSLHFGVDADTGLYSAGANDLGVAAGGAQVASFDAAGLDVTGDVSATGEFLAADGTLGAPGYSFTSDTDTGFALNPGVAGDNADIGLMFGGAIVFAWDDTTGVLHHGDGGENGSETAADYATNLSQDYHLPNKKYVDDLVAASSPAVLGDIGNVTETGLADNDFLVYNGTNWVNENPATARASLDVYSTTTADANFVDVTGDTMTGDLVMSGAVITNTAGTVLLPSYTFVGDTDTGMSAATADTLVLSAGGAAIVTASGSSVTTTQPLLGPNGTAGAPALSFSGDSDTGVYNFGADSVGIAVGGANALTVESNGTVNVAGTTDYETLVTDDDDVPNKKYVDDAISGAVGSTTLAALTDTDVTLNTGPNDDDMLIYNSVSGNWENQSPAETRTSLGLDSGGAGDIWVDVAGDTMTGALAMGSNKITGLANGTDPADAVNRSQLDAAAAGLLPKAPARVATTVDLDSVGNGTWVFAANGTPGVDGVGSTLTAGTAGTTTIDGVLLANGDRVLVKDQGTGLENGIYEVSAADAGSATVFTRATDFDGSPSSEVQAGSFLFIEEGTTQDFTGWALQDVGLTGGGSPTQAIVDTDALSFVQFQGLPSFIGGNGIDITGDTISVDEGRGLGFDTGVLIVDLYDASTSALILTTDGSTRSTAAGAQLELLLDSNGSLSQGAGGLSVAASTFTGDTGSDTTVLPGETMNFIGGQSINTTVAASGSNVDVTFAADLATEAATQGAGTVGVAEFKDGDFIVTSGFVELDPVGVQDKISLTFSPATGDDIVLSGVNDTLNIDSTTLSVVGTAGTSTIDIDLNAVLSDLNNVSNDTSPSGAAIEAPAVSGSFINRLYDGGEGEDVFRQGAMTNAAPNSSYGPIGSSRYSASIHRGAQMLVWDSSEGATGEWVTAWFDGAMTAVGLNGFYDWAANSTIAAADAAYADGGFTNVTGTAWPTPGGGDAQAVDVFLRWDNANGQWKNFTPAQMVDMLNAQGGLNGAGQFVLTADSGTNQNIATGATGDTLTIAGGTGIDTVVGATDTVTVSLNAGLNDLTDVILTSSAAGETLVYNGSEYVNEKIHHVEASASATSHAINHALGQQYVNVTVVDSSDQVIIPQSITMTDANNLTVTLSSAAAVTVIVTGVPGA